MFIAIPPADERARPKTAFGFWPVYTHFKYRHAVPQSKHTAQQILLFDVGLFGLRL
jgi:hypothetical protein